MEAAGPAEVAGQRALLPPQAEVQGPGLPPGSEARVFDKSFRGVTKTNDGRRGVGLGLAICQAIVEAHDGKISAGNRPGGGAEFVIALPCREAAPRIVLEELTAKAEA